MLPDRRTFLRRAAAACLAAPPSLAWGCRPPPRDGEEALTANGAREAPQVATSGAGVRLLDAPGERPFAYLSRAQRRVYVARDRRESAAVRLGAYVSVTTGLWRIRLPGDDPLVPVSPGDPLREYEEVDLRAWDPDMEPAEGDARLRPGAQVEVSMLLPCTPLGAGGASVRGGPWRFSRLEGGGGPGGREEFRVVGTAYRSPGGGCAGDGAAVSVLAWALPDR